MSNKNKIGYYVLQNKTTSMYVESTFPSKKYTKNIMFASKCFSYVCAKTLKDKHHTNCKLVPIYRDVQRKHIQYTEHPKCKYCNREFNNAEVDHINDRFRNNLLVSFIRFECKSCNNINKIKNKVMVVYNVN